MYSRTWSLQGQIVLVESKTGEVDAVEGFAEEAAKGDRGKCF